MRKASNRLLSIFPDCINKNDNASGNNQEKQIITHMQGLKLNDNKTRWFLGGRFNRIVLAHEWASRGLVSFRYL